MASSTPRTTNSQIGDRLGHLEATSAAQTQQMAQITSSISKLSEDVKALSKPQYSLMLTLVSMVGGLITLYVAGPKETIARHETTLAELKRLMTMHVQAPSHVGSRARMQGMQDQISRTQIDTDLALKKIAGQERNSFNRQDFDKYVLGRFIPNEAKLAKLGQELAAFRAKTDTGSRFTREDFDRYVLPRLDAMEIQVANHSKEQAAINSRQTECLDWIRATLRDKHK